MSQKDTRTAEQRRSEGKAWVQAKIDERYEIAASNRSERAKRSPYQQLKVLDRRLGIGKGAKKERARLAGKVGLTYDPDQD
jgi:hypothetical protein